VTDFTTYQPPDVYIEEERVSLVNVIGVDPSVVGIVGPSIGHRSAIETIVLTGTTPYLLAEKGIDVNTIVVRDASGAVQAITTSYTVATGPGEDVGTPTDNTTTITRVAGGGSTISDGESVSVSYQYTDEVFNSPQRFTRYEDVVEFFGAAIDLTTGAITSPLTLAANIAFTNGVGQVVLVHIGDDPTLVTTAEIEDGLAMLDSYFDVDIIVLLPVGIAGTNADHGDTTAVGTALRNSLTNAESERLFRIGILGFDTTVTRDMEELPAEFDHQRLVLAGPSRMLYYNGLLNRDMEVSGYYLAAAYAGALVRNGVEQPLTKKQIRGFSGIPGRVFQQMTSSYKNTLSQSGVAVTELARDGRFVVRHGVTTDGTDILTREISLVRTRDALVNLMRETMDRSGLIGGVVDDDSLARVKSAVDGCLMAAQTGKIIRSYTQPVVRQQSANPTIIEVKFQYGPLYPMNYIVISFSINTTTGEITPVTNPLAA
jgi:hypothetical protein